MSLFNLKLCTHIWSTNINCRPPLHGTFWSILVWTFTLWVNCRGDVFCRRQKRDYLGRTSSQQCARGAIKNPRRRTAAFWKPLNAAIRPILINLVCTSQTDRKPKIENFKIQDGGWRPSWKSKNHDISETVRPILTKFCTMAHINPLGYQLIKISNF